MSDLPLFSAAERRTLTVSELTERIKGTLQDEFASVSVSGEITDLACPSSGHFYFTLKDGAAQIRCAMWRSAAARVKFRLEDGLEVVCRGGVEVYSPRGQYQLIVQQLEPKGEGALQLALRKLREKLSAEGLFARERKRPLPPFPRRVGFVTSPTGAAIRDFLEVARRRCAGMEVLVIPARVQGDCAGDEIVAGIELANRLRPPLDVLVVGRGGGSIEDLWCFNEEKVVRAIHASRVPVVSAVGHEIDVTLSDLVADVRALTPSEAAERVVPALTEISERLRALRQAAARALRGRLDYARAKLDALARQPALRRPFDLLHALMQRLDELESRATRGVKGRIAQARERVAGLARSVESLSPLAVLGRGYSLTRRLDGELVRDAADLRPGDRVRTTLAAGEFTSRVEESG